MKKQTFVVLVVLAVLAAVGGSHGLRSANAQGILVQLGFTTETATHAAVGVPVRWTMTLRNTGTTKATLTKSVNLVAPDSTTYSLYSKSVAYNAGASDTTAQDLTTSTLT